MEPIQIASVNDLLVQVSRQLKEHGWAIIGTVVDGFPYHFTLGLESRWQHPELEVVGLTPELGEVVLERLVRRIKAGERLHPGDFFSDVLKGYDVFVVDNPVQPGGPPVTGGRLRVIWPDANHRYPWQPECESVCAAQSRLIEPDGLDRHGLELLCSYSGRLA